MRDRTVIVGGPRTGKTTLAEKMGKRVVHTDDMMTAGGFSEQSARAVEELGKDGQWVMEGVTTVRALRKWLASHPTGKPCDEIVHLDRPLVSLTAGQASLQKGCETVFQEIAGELRRRGVIVRPKGAVDD